LVYGAGVAGGAIPLTEGALAIPAMWLANKYLPPAPGIGHAVVHGILGPLSNIYADYDPISLEAYGE
jgi:hypothetical protein